jgi:hypothetical protein
MGGNYMQVTFAIKNMVAIIGSQGMAETEIVRTQTLEFSL